MNRFYAFLLLFFLFSFITTVIASETDDEDDFESIQIINGQIVIFLDEETQETSGIETILLQKTEFQAEFLSFGKAISIMPLLSIQNQFHSASSKRTSAKVRVNQLAKDVSRLRDLHKDKAVSTRKLQTQQSQWQSDKAVYNEMSNQSKIIISNSKLQWGKKLTQWAIENSPQFDNLINGESILLQITLPIGHSIPSNTKTVFISPAGNRNEAFSVSFISQLPQVDKLSQGFQYLFIAESTKIKPGMHFSAWIPLHEQAQQGIIIPKSSLGWHLGQAFVFIKINTEQFVHRNITNPINVTNGFFIVNGIKEGEEIVVTGSQMLLSHEFRSQIPDEDDD